MDYLGDDIDLDNVHSTSDTSKLSLLTEEEMQAAVSEKELPFEGTTTTEGILSVSFFILSLSTL